MTPQVFRKNNKLAVFLLQQSLYFIFLSYGKASQKRMNGRHFLPRTGYKTVSVKEEFYNRLQRKAKAANRSISEYIQNLTEAEKAQKEKLKSETQ